MFCPCDLGTLKNHLQIIICQKFCDIILPLYFNTQNRDCGKDFYCIVYTANFNILFVDNGIKADLIKTKTCELNVLVERDGWKPMQGFLHAWLLILRSSSVTAV